MWANDSKASDQSPLDPMMLAVLVTATEQVTRQSVSVCKLL